AERGADVAALHGIERGGLLVAGLDAVGHAVGGGAEADLPVGGVGAEEAERDAAVARLLVVVAHGAGPVFVVRERERQLAARKRGAERRGRRRRDRRAP